MPVCILLLARCAFKASLCLVRITNKCQTWLALLSICGKVKSQSCKLFHIVFRLTFFCPVNQIRSFTFKIAACKPSNRLLMPSISYVSSSRHGAQIVQLGGRWASSVIKAPARSSLRFCPVKSNVEISSNCPTFVPS